MTPPVFAHGHLRLYLLSLLAERPMHGYEIITALSDRFGGTYTPSPGTIYPRLSKLEEEGLVDKTTDGRKTVYTITDDGRAELAERRSDLDGIESELSDSVRRLADEVRASVDGAMRSLRADLAAAARDARDESRASGRVRDTVHGARDQRDQRDQERERGGETRTLFRDADHALTDFRGALRSELGRASARGLLTPEAVTALVDGLDRVRAEVLETLGAHRR